jgi:hypothetical protein
MSEERSDIQINFERAEVSSEPLTAEQLLLQSLPGLLDFADDYPLYPEMLPFVYKIYRDLYLSGLYENIEILDGQLLNMSIYYFRGKIATKKLSRVLIPFDFDQDVDLQWYVICLLSGLLLFSCLYCQVGTNREGV